MKKILFIIVCLGFVLANHIAAQQKAQIRIRKNVNGVESQETREFMLDDSRQLEDILNELNEQNANESGLVEQQIEISILSEDGLSGSPSNGMPFGIVPFSNTRKPTLGVMLREYPAKKSRRRVQKLVTITEVMKQTPADMAGLQSGDVIIRVDDTPITAAQQVLDLVKLMEVRGGDLEVVVKRKNRKKKILVHIVGKPVHTWGNEQFGFYFDGDITRMFGPGQGDTHIPAQPFNKNNEGFNTDETAYLGVTPSDMTTTTGVAVNVEDQSPAQEMGLMDGDVVLELNGEIIGDFNALSAAVRKCKPGSIVDILILRDNKEKRITGSLGKRSMSASDDFQIFHDFKGQGDNGDLFYDFEFNMDAEDLQKQMEQFFRDLNDPMPNDMHPFNSADASAIIHIEEATPEQKTKLEIPSATLAPEEMTLVPNTLNGAVELNFKIANNEPVTVIMKDASSNILFFDERALTDMVYRRSISLNAYPEGDYYLIISQGSRAYAKKLVKSKLKK